MSDEKLTYHRDYIDALSRVATSILGIDTQNIQRLMAGELGEPATDFLVFNTGAYELNGFAWLDTYGLSNETFNRQWRSLFFYTTQSLSAPELHFTPILCKRIDYSDAEDLCSFNVYGVCVSRTEIQPFSSGNGFPCASLSDYQCKDAKPCLAEIVDDRPVIKIDGKPLTTPKISANDKLNLPIGQVRSSVFGHLSQAQHREVVPGKPRYASQLVRFAKVLFG